MKPGTRNLRALSVALAALAGLHGCAVTRPATKEEVPPGLSLRLPPAEITTLDIRSHPSAGHPDLPMSVVDESRGRWLTLFELNYSPAKTSPPPVEEGP
jgi:hypothetical protein